MPKMLRALWDGIRLRCPRCREGEMFRTWFETHPKCPRCRVQFQPYEGDFLGTMAVTYGLTVFLGLALFGLAFKLTDWTMYQHLIAYSTFCVVWYFAFYRQMKGLWVALLYLMTGLRKEL